MMYRGVYRDGYVELEGAVDLRNGAEVEVNALRAAEPRSANGSAKKRKPTQPRVSSKSSVPVKKAAHAERATFSWRPKKMTKAERLAALQEVIGAWKDPPEWVGRSSAEIAAELRVRASTRGRRG